MAALAAPLPPPFQEDFALLRVSDEPGPSPQESKHVMTAACVVFSFHGLAEKLGTTTLNIHAPVPGFEDQLEKVLNRTFTALQVRSDLCWLAGLVGERVGERAGRKAGAGVGGWVGSACCVGRWVWISMPWQRDLPWPGREAGHNHPQHTRPGTRLRRATGKGSGLGMG
jgi:hypothetical protein